jgi:hypothetical protein
LGLFIKCVTPFAFYNLQNIPLIPFSIINILQRRGNIGYPTKNGETFGGEKAIIEPILLNPNTVKKEKEGPCSA